MTSRKPAATAATPQQPLALTIRFSLSSVHDISLDIPYPHQTTVISLKHLIRSRLTEPNSQRRLRFIQGGKILPDNAVLSSVLRSPPPPPPTSNHSHDAYTSGRHNGGSHVGAAGEDEDVKGKGKGVANRPPQQRIFISCSIGDSLTTAELAAEAKAASAPVSEIHTPDSKPGTPIPQPRSTTATPRGFDRLLAAGFTPAEVNSLRLQFRSIHASRHTPDTMPSPDTFRRMEDSWMDDNGAIPTTGGGQLGGGGGIESDESMGVSSHLDAVIWGIMTGFMWPLGSFGWLFREQGIHSDRWSFMVFVGVLFSVLIGIVRGISGEK